MAAFSLNPPDLETPQPQNFESVQLENALEKNPESLYKSGLALQ
jgi:hypothetical protein